MEFTRRTLITSAAAATLFARPSTGRAAYTEVMPGVWDVGITTLPLKTVIQDCEQWCWAASLQTIFAHWGYNVPQEDLAAHFLGVDYSGSPICAPASDDLMLACINSKFTRPSGSQFKSGYFLAKGASTHPADYAWWDIVRMELTNDRPLLAAYHTGPNTGHAVVITHVRFQKIPAPTGGFMAKLIGMTVRDPWPYSPNKRQLTYGEVLNLSFIACVNVKDV